MRTLSQLSANLSALGDGRIDVAEVYGPGRYTTRAGEFGLTPGIAFDLRTGWDFNLEADREEARRRRREEKPLLLIGSPFCWPFSTMRGYADDPFEFWDYGVTHLDFVVSLYREQRNDGLFYAHEHPRAATSYRAESMQELIREEDTIVFDNEQCAFGATGVDQFGTALVCKPSTWVTNFPRLAKALNRRCSNLTEPDRSKWHRHCCVLGNTVNRKEIWRQVERHPPRIVSTILQCVRDHLRETHQI